MQQSSTHHLDVEEDENRPEPFDTPEIAAFFDQLFRWFEPNKNRIMKVGRNSPCPCGSGEKHKKCCIDKVNLVASYVDKVYDIVKGINNGNNDPGI